VDLFAGRSCYRLQGELSAYRVDAVLNMIISGKEENQLDATITVY
jgi:hypothetical protein